MTSNASRSSSAPDFMPHVHDVLPYTALFFILYVCFSIMILIVEGLREKVGVHTRKHLQDAFASMAGVPSKKILSCPACFYEIQIDAEYEDAVRLLVTFGDAEAIVPASEVLRDVIGLFQCDPVWPATRMEVAIDCYMADVSAEGNAQATINDVSTGTITTTHGQPLSTATATFAIFAESAGDEMGLDEQDASVSTAAGRSTSSATDDAVLTADTGDEESPSSSRYSTRFLDTEPESPTDESRLIEAIRNAPLPVSPYQVPDMRHG